MVAKGPSFVEVVATASSKPRGEAMHPFEVTLPSGARVVVPSRFDVNALDALISVLEGAD